MNPRLVGAALAAIVLAAGATAEPPPEISVEEAYSALATGELILIDVRTPAEWQATGLAPGAARATLKAPDFLGRIDAIAEGDKTAPIAFICRSGRRSAEARDLAQEAGYIKVTHVAGGMLGETGWISASLPVSKPPPGDCNPGDITATC